jgi:hypothetical protein
MYFENTRTNKLIIVTGFSRDANDPSRDLVTFLSEDTNEFFTLSYDEFTAMAPNGERMFRPHNKLKEQEEPQFEFIQG